MANRKLLVVITGPTAVGKTGVAIQLAKHFHSVIISADSRQFYREIPIGTAQPSVEEMDGVKHHLIASHSIHDVIDSGAYERMASKILEEEFKTHDVVFVCGGSGLYIEALINGFDELPEADPEIRKALRKKFEEEGIAPLQEELKKLDPEYYEKVDKDNHARIMRALEICKTSGKKYSELRKGEKKKNDFEVMKFCIDLPREELYARIDARVDAMVEKGLEQEARTVHPFKELGALRTVGYKEMFDHFEGKTSLEKAVELIKQHSRNYAKRQLTWWRNKPNIRWMSPFQTDVIIGEIDTFLSN
ncbi:MAG TPA: tRNA (adenosine(37)-N6)-dimethylallyltransferase MiaA [Bacteroidia bacterium]|nr:tRNA (adenosine(37)-N6)-dimethylallyltransferase MiaA [Bacteroidia bacterium]